jgi:hypothetical protein
MTKLKERVLIYTALAAVCSFGSVFLGVLVGALSFIQIAAVIEGLFWFGPPRPRASRLRQQRILFNG